jgi:hypothetical protein
MLNKFSVSIPTTETRKVYGYKNGESMIYWKNSHDQWVYFCMWNGNAGKAVTTNRYDDTSRFAPIYEPFSINIGA